MKIKEFFKRMLCGADIGTAMIIPGVSGGTLAVLLNIYDKLINAISDLRKDFLNSFKFLLPIVLGAGLAVVAMYFPLSFALKHAPLATVLFFVGLMLGSMPKLIKDSAKLGFKAFNVASIIIPFIIVIAISVIPAAVPDLGTVDLSSTMNAGSYILLALVGVLASCALVIPGVSGSMLLMILGYYQPILDTVSTLTTNFGHSVLVLAVFAVGIIFGFITIAKIIKFLLAKFPRGTMWAIVGFVIGSFPAIFIVFAGEYGYANVTPIEIICGVILAVIGAIGTYLLTLYEEKRNAKSSQKTE